MILTVRRSGNKTTSNLRDSTGTHNDKNCALFGIQSLKKFCPFFIVMVSFNFFPWGGRQMRLYGLLGGGGGGASIYLCGKCVAN